MQKILIVEDDSYLQRNLREILMNHHYEVLTASTRQEGMYYVLNCPDVDLYLLDVWLPDGEGFDLCRQIRRQNEKPILFLTACDNETSVVRGLDMGADDYISKPFRAAELLSRIQANLRRQSKSSSAGSCLICGEICLDPEAGTVTIKGRQLELRPVEYRLLLLFMRNAGAIVKRDQLLEQLWDGSEDSVEDNTLSVHISRLRRKIGLDYIETVRGFGYRFTKQVVNGKNGG